jgi:hypothetical protein
MRRHVVIDGISLAFVLALGSCNNNNTGITVSERFTATLSAANERPTPDSSTATGTATFTYLSDIGSIFYRLDVAGIDSAFAAHIHGPAVADSNAAVVINLFTNPTTKIGFTGTLAQGVLGELGAPVAMTMDSLLVLLRNGHAYVNVHTRGPVSATTHSGGHFGGEIRGQVVKQ